MKVYIELPFLASYRRYNKTTHIPLCIWMTFSWMKYDFERCDDNDIFPKGKKIGKQLFVFSFGAFYWGVCFIFYRPKTTEQ